MQNSKTTLGAIFTVIGLIPTAINQLGLAEVPSWLSTAGLVCTFISIVYTGYNAQDSK